MTPPPDNGLSPRAAATLLAVVALLAVGLFVVAAAIDGKSSDRLYDPINREMHTPSEVQMTPDLWKRKGEPAPEATTPQVTLPAASPAPAVPAIPIKIKRDADQPPPQKPQQPPSTGPS